MDEKDKKVWENLQFPTITNIAPRLACDDIEGFDPRNPKDVEKWKKIFGDMHKRVKEDFDKKGIPMPEIVLDTSKRPLREDDHPLLR